MIDLWTINRWLRFTGFRLTIAWDTTDDKVPTKIGFTWWGSPWKMKK